MGLLQARQPRNVLVRAMKVLVVARCKKGRYAPFITEQVKAVERQGIQCQFFGIDKKGISGYFSHLKSFRRVIRDYRPDVIHAHYGFSGLFANSQRRIPVVTTYHGSDINNPKLRFISRFSMCLSAWNIFVSRKTLEIAGPNKRFSLLPCGIDLNESQKTLKSHAREQTGLDREKKYVLFAGSFGDLVKNAPLAKETVSLLGDNVELLELRGYSRKEVTLLMCAVDAFLMTSLSEGSPQVIKEALACGCPIVSVDVGDVRERVSGVAGCFVAETYAPEELAGLLRRAIAFEDKTPGLERVVSDGLDNVQIAGRLSEIYTSVTKK